MLVTCSSAGALAELEKTGAPAASLPQNAHAKAVHNRTRVRIPRPHATSDVCADDFPLSSCGLQPPAPSDAAIIRATAAA